MTAEVAVLNSVGVALAADSAVTVGLEAGKIYTSADKLFQFSSYAPVGVMVYGNASLLGVPWETIIKSYRIHLGGRTFPFLEDYAQDFIRFLRNSKQFFPAKSQRGEFHAVVRGYFTFVRERFEQLIREEYDKGNRLTESQASQIFANLVTEELESTRKWPPLEGLPLQFTDRIRTAYVRDINSVAQKVFQKLPMSRITRGRLVDTMVEVVTHERLLQREQHAGVVVAGFGDKEHFPQLSEHVLLGILGGHPLHCRGAEASIAGQEAVVIPFAQREMVMTFMDGIDPDLRENIERSTGELFKALAKVIVDEVRKKYAAYGAKLEKSIMVGLDKVLKELYDNWSEVRRKGYDDPVMEMVASLPKDELGIMAESLVSLTKFKRRISKQHETVGGPIDVAVITKGDGFVWMKRKHYFAAEMNPRYIARVTKWSD